MRFGRGMGRSREGVYGRGARVLYHLLGGVGDGQWAWPGLLEALSENGGKRYLYRRVDLWGDCGAMDNSLYGVRFTGGKTDNIGRACLCCLAAVVGEVGYPANDTDPRGLGGAG